MPPETTETPRTEADDKPNPWVDPLYPPTTEPWTKAGKDFDVAWPGTHIDRLQHRSAILDIEAEAARLALEGVAERVRAVSDPGYMHRDDVLALLSTEGSGK